MDGAGPEGAINLLDYVFNRIQLYGNKVAQVDSLTGQTRTYSEIWERAQENGRRLRESGIGRGCVVGLCLENRLEVAELLLGVLQAGAVAAFYPPAATQRELEHLISITRPTLVIASEARDELIGAMSKFPSGKLLTVAEIDTYEDTFMSETPVPLCHSLLSSPAVLLASSGSTGLPKAVILKHSNLIWALSACGDLLMKESTPALGLMPFYHAYGLGLMLMALCKGSQYIIMNKFGLNEFTSTLTKYKIEYLHVVPSLIVKLTSDEIPADKLRYLRAVFSGAGAVGLKLQKALLSKLHPEARLYHSYGMTETAHIVAFGEVREDKPGSPGRILPCMKAKVLGVDGQEVDPGVSGELCLQGPMVTPGYYNNPEATEESFTYGWLKTGDLAYIDQDGYLYIVDRLKDIVKFQGYQISVTELEQVLIEHKGVKEVAVIGVEHEKYGEVPKAFVVPNEKVRPTEEEIQQAVSRVLSHYKWLRGGVKFVESLPKTQSMKINRKLLRSMN